jgi:hypothetical protein
MRALSDFHDLMEFRKELEANVAKREARRLADLILNEERVN